MQEEDNTRSAAPFRPGAGPELGSSGIEDRDSLKRLVESERLLRALAFRLMEAQEKERARIARDLHDSIGSLLTGIKMLTENSIAMLKEGNTDPAMLERIVPVIQEAIDESRRITSDLRPSILDDLGIISTIHWFCERHRAMYPFIHIETEIEAEETDVPKEIRIVIYRIMQEAFNNIAKHSKAEYVTLSLARRGNLLIFAIEDNGDGFDIKKALSSGPKDHGFGLAGMKERVELAKGFFNIESTPSVGTTLKVSWDCRKFLTAGPV